MRLALGEQSAAWAATVAAVLAGMLSTSACATNPTPRCEATGECPREGKPVRAPSPPDTHHQRSDGGAATPEPTPRQAPDAQSVEDAGRENETDASTLALMEGATSSSMALGTDGGDAATEHSADGAPSPLQSCAEPSWASPAEDPCAIDERTAFFVSPSGRPDAAGTRLDPLSSVQAAADRAAALRRRVFVCATEGPLEQQLRLSVAHASLTLYGGFDCDTWNYGTDHKARLLGAEPAAVILEASSDVHFEDFAIQSRDRSTLGVSSIALLLSRSLRISFTRVDVLAGAGAKGEAGVDGLAGTAGDLPGTAQHGRAGYCAIGRQPAPPTSQPGGSWPRVGMCGSRGGRGGLARLDSNGGDGYTGLPPAPETPVGNGGLLTPQTVAADGAAGRAGEAGAPGTPGPLIGEFSYLGYRPAAAVSGQIGTAGTGGSGGGAGVSITAGTALCLAASGGAGGMGGCPGGPGGGGLGGGASVGVLSLASQATFTACTITSGRGGAGGDGGSSGLGGLGGLGANGGSPAPLGEEPLALTAAGRGGDGGDGGPGGAGAGGSGGPSLALAVQGERPALNDTQLQVGKAGRGGLGGTYPEGFDAERAPAGPEGLASAEMQLDDG